MSKNQLTTEVFISSGGAAIALTFKRTTTTTDGKTLHDIYHDGDVLYRPAGDEKFYACLVTRMHECQTEAGDYQADFWNDDHHIPWKTLIRNHNVIQYEGEEFCKTNLVLDPGLVVPLHEEIRRPFRLMEDGNRLIYISQCSGFGREANRVYIIESDGTARKLELTDDPVMLGTGIMTFFTEEGTLVTYRRLHSMQSTWDKRAIEDLNLFDYAIIEPPEGKFRIAKKKGVRM